MTIKSFLKRLILIEEKIDTLQSPVNGVINVYEDLFGKKTMRIDKVSQSGELVDTLWQKALSEVRKRKKVKVQDILVLGLGCGGCAKLIAKKWPEAKIVGVDVDPVVIEVGKKYFGLDEIANLKIEITNAFKFVDPVYKIHNTKYDLILVDLYLGQNFPKEAENEEFVTMIKNLLTENGVVIFNRFYWGKYRLQARDFEKKLKNYFPKVWTKKAISNLLIFCKK